MHDMTYLLTLPHLCLCVDQYKHQSPAMPATDYPETRSLLTRYFKILATDHKKSANFANITQTKFLLDIELLAGMVLRLLNKSCHDN